ncbi:14402_t:CDS:2 [Entrophospora sp. SA101]|nr:14402_t:CDS:2 [Entrophospora sp. SA101]
MPGMIGHVSFVGFFHIIIDRLPVVIYSLTDLQVVHLKVLRDPNLFDESTTSACFTILAYGIYEAIGCISDIDLRDFVRVTHSGPLLFFYDKRRNKLTPERVLNCKLKCPKNTNNDNINMDITIIDDYGNIRGENYKIGDDDDDCDNNNIENDIYFCKELSRIHNNNTFTIDLF